MIRQRIALLLVLLWPTTSLATTVDIPYTAISSGFMTGSNASYGTAHAVPAAVFTNDAVIGGSVRAGTMGQFLESGLYHTYRSFWAFNTSTTYIPTNATITSLTLHARNLGLIIDGGGRNFNLEIRNYQNWTTTNLTLSTTDWQQCLNAPIDALLCVSNGTPSCASAGLEITSQELQPANLVLGVGAVTRYCLTTNIEAAGLTAVGNEYLASGDAVAGNAEPYLEVVYSIQSPAPTVTPTPTNTPTRTFTPVTTPTRLPCFDGSPGPNCTPPRCGEVTQQ